MTQKNVKISLELTADGQFNCYGNGSEGVNKLDQCRALMLGIYAIARDELGVNPAPSTLEGLAEWAEQVIG